MAMERLFESTSIGRMRLRNRLVMPPMVTGYASEDGDVTPQMIDYFVARARGGVGLIIVEAAYIRQDGKGFPRQLGIHKDGLIPGLKQMVQAVQSEGAKIAIQLFHGGRQVSSLVTGSQPIAPSPIPDPVTNELPREITLAEIEQVQRDYVAAAKRAVQAGFDAIELHGAHGYLIAQFLSPFSNRRIDAYGAGIHGRARFALEIIEKVREALGPDYPITFRISGEERVEGGLTLGQTMAIAPRLERAGIDCLHVSVGNYATPGSLPTAPMDVPIGLLMPMTAQLKKTVSIPVIAVNRIHDPLLAEQVVATGIADMVAIGRPLLTDPNWPNKAQRGELDDIFPCISCNQACIGQLQTGTFVSCLLNPACGRERELAITKTQQPKWVMVVGGGPAGLEAARVLAERGHHVHLVEEDEQLGGEFLVAAMPPNKEEVAHAINWMVRRVHQLGVKVDTGTRATREMVERLRPDAVILATGARPIPLNVPGMEPEKTCFARDVLLGLKTTGSNVLVVGGGPVGLEVAEYLGVQQRRVTVLEPTPVFGAAAHPSHRYWLMDSLDRMGALLFSGTELDSFRNGVAYIRRDGQVSELGAFDSVVVALGYQSNDELHSQLQDIVPQVYLVGDALAPCGAVESILQATRAARQI